MMLPKFSYLFQTCMLTKSLVMEPDNSFRPLFVQTPRPHPLNNRFAWLAGIALVVLFLTCVAMAYAAHLAQLR